ncbi:MAG: mandelate racemase [Mycobacterium sp.]|jgi:hypothetical protein|nr:mandelate racemase [Mycobacterium sp.]
MVNHAETGYFSDAQRSRRIGACRRAASVEIRSWALTSSLGHCAPNLHAHVAAAIPNLRHLEYFHDHHRIEHMLFDGALPPDGGALRPDQHRPGRGSSSNTARPSSTG